MEKKNYSKIFKCEVGKSGSFTIDASQEIFFQGVCMCVCVLVVVVVVVQQTPLSSGLKKGFFVRPHSESIGNNHIHFFISHV